MFQLYNAVVIFFGFQIAHASTLERTGP